MPFDTASLLEDAAAHRDHPDASVRTLALGANEAAYEINELNERVRQLELELTALRRLSESDTHVTLPLSALPAAITDSARAVLSAHGLALTGPSGPVQTEPVLRELGNNVSQALYGLSLGDDDAPILPAPAMPDGQWANALAIIDELLGDSECYAATIGGGR